MMSRAFAVLVLLTAGLLPASRAQAAHLWEEPAGFFLTTEAFSYGGLARPSPGGVDFTTFRIASVDLRYQRLRVGTSLIEAGYGFGSLSLLSARLGYTIWQSPRPYLWKLHGMEPELYLQTAGTLWPVNGDAPPYDKFVGHAEVRAAADVFGLGLDAGVGVATVYGTALDATSPKWTVRPSIDARLRIGVASFGL